MRSVPGLIPTILAVALVGCGGDDLQNANNQDAAVPDARPPVCGNGLPEAGEECDDGNLEAGDGCSPTCQIEQECGNGVREGSEECDGNPGAHTCVGEGHLLGQVVCDASCLLDCSGCEDAHDDLVAWYRLDGQSGLIVDSTFSGNSCTVQGAMERGFPGVIGRAFLFNGSDSYGDCPDVGMDALDALTVELWFKTTSFSPEGVFVGRADAADASGLSFFVGLAGDPDWAPHQYQVFFGTDNPDDLIFSGSTIYTDQWHHVGAVFAAGEMSLYLDGVEVASATTLWTGPIRDLPGSRTFLGHLHDQGDVSGWDTFYQGYLDEVKLWSIPRTQAEICADAGGRPAGGGCDLPDL